MATLRKQFPEAQCQTLASYVYRNFFDSPSPALGLKFPKPRLSWDAIHREVPGGGGLLTVSRVGLSSDGREAFLSAHNRVDSSPAQPLNRASGTLPFAEQALLRLEDERWKVVKSRVRLYPEHQGDEDRRFTWNDGLPRSLYAGRFDGSWLGAVRLGESVLKLGPDGLMLDQEMIPFEAGPELLKKLVVGGRKAQQRAARKAVARLLRRAMDLAAVANRSGRR
ncbi:MAG: hypothetical protein AB7S38_08915 [Vulcanimicrobiota bacterium]